MFLLDGVSFQPENKHILHPTSLAIAKGKVTTLLGHNGSGKSTLLKLLSRKIAPTQGNILLTNTALDQFSAKEFAFRVGYLPQHPPITEGVTVYELVQFGRYPWKGVLGRYNDDDHRIVGEAISDVGLTSMSERFVSTLSGGERQRAWVAMLLAQQSECILLDEPTSALDVAHQYELLSLIRNLNTSRGITVIMVLHDINMAARFSDTLIALHSGRVLAQGSPDDLMTEATLASIYGIPLGKFQHPQSGHTITYVL
ncbi:ABC transporter ATP-binding protein [Enterovibrio sp. 27052020O]|uniref:ABC transporter ATP-binding protein n=1 Tax=Enterovibrio sp. 27052020O TaxID=3241166 RepID=UPI00388EA2A4